MIPGRGYSWTAARARSASCAGRFGNRADECLRNLGAVWISHPADHHLGLPSLLAERRRLAPDKPSPILMAPWPVLRWLGDYAAVYAPLSGAAYVPVECQWMKEDAPHPQQQRLNGRPAPSSKCGVPVPHCAQAYGVVVKAVDGWSLCYSGDCRPSSKLAAAARDCTVLIHEATFSDGLEDDAVKSATRRSRKH